MWRNNILRLRTRSSTASWPSTRLYSSQASLPITDAEFWEALGAIDRSITSPEHEYIQRIGLAISGGVDSMALAALFANPEPSDQSANSRLRAHAFIVDHKVRPESTEEAEWVAEQCRSKFGMEASVLPLHWPTSLDSLNHKRFETDARMLRYQALGRACREARIKKIFLAHHADDQAETVLMRLSKNRLRTGLRGMQPVEWIPECQGIYGVSHSGTHYGKDLSLTHLPFPIEDGGVRIMRPLLGFEKSRLIATCKHNGVSWAEDKTNHLKTYTSRNAIRHVLNNHKLPAALSIKSLVDMSLQMQKRVRWHKLDAKRLLNSCLMKLDIQSGSLLIRFPTVEKILRSRAAHSERSNLSHPSQSDLNDAKNTAYCLLEQVGQLITPRDSAPLGELAATIGNIWPEFSDLDNSDSSQAEVTGNKTSYSIYSIWWRKWEKRSPFPGAHKNRIGAVVKHHPREWLLTRQPLEHHRPGGSSKPIQYPPSHTLTNSDNIPTPSPSRGEDDFRLIDGRWWINLQNHSAAHLTLRIFTEQDFSRLPSLLEAKHRGVRPERFIVAALSMLKPADLRFTLPAVFQLDAATGKESLVGFPTLNVSIDGVGYPSSICSWQVRYKKVDLTTAKLAECVDEGITQAMIQKSLARPGGVIKLEAKRSEMKRVDKKKKKSGRSVGADESTMPGFSGRTAKQNREDGMNGNNIRLRNGKQVLQNAVQGSDTFEGSKAPLIPVPESQRHGRSRKNEDGGYDIEWEDVRNHKRS